MASGHVNRANRPNTWLLRPMLQMKILLANPEPSTHGPSRHFAAKQRFGHFRREADINWQTKPAGSVANDPKRTFGHIVWAVTPLSRSVAGFAGDIGAVLTRQDIFDHPSMRTIKTG
jgi:hypothetical protein